jgi:hypothetical protein
MTHRDPQRDRLVAATPVAARAAFALASVLAALYCALASWRTWPPIDGDGTAFFPAAVEWSLSRPLANPLPSAPLDAAFDGPTGRRYVYHGFLYPMVVGQLGRSLGGGPEATVVAAYMVHWLTGLIAALAVHTWARTHREPFILLSGLLPLAMSSLSVAWHGRPEPLAILLLGAGALAWGGLRGAWRDLSMGCLAALLVSSSPAAGVLAVVGTVVAVVVSIDARRIPTRVLIALTGFVATSVLVIVAYPYSLADWVAGLTQWSEYIFSLPTGQGAVQTWVAEPKLPLLAVSVGLLIIAAAAGLGDSVRRLPIARQVIAGVLLAAFCLAMIRIAFLKTEASYNAVVWMPVLACIAVSSGTSRWRTVFVTVALLFPAAGLARSGIVLSRQFQPESVTFGEARQRIQELAVRRCSVSSGLWLVVDDVRGVAIEDRDAPEGECFVRQQTMTGMASPPTYPGFRLVEDRYGPGIRLFGIPLSRTPGGWEFAVYERIDHSHP